MSRNFFPSFTALVLLGFYWTNVVAAEAPVHLSLAFRVIETVAPTNNAYIHRPIFLSISGVNGSKETVNRSDCSGLVILLLKEAYGLEDAYFKETFGKTRPLAKEFAAAIASEKGFKKISSVKELMAGDILAAEYLEAVESGDTGHVLLVASNFSADWKHEASAPLVEKTEQFLVPIIDSSKSAHWKGDSRPKGQTGIGFGFLRIYAGVDGKIAGYSWSAGPASEYRANDKRPLFAGRLIFKQ